MQKDPATQREFYVDTAGESHWTLPTTKQPEVQPELQPEARLEEVDLRGVSLPQGWTAHTDQDSGNVYYSNAKSGQTQWARPAEHLPIQESLPTSSSTPRQHQSVRATPVSVGAVERELMPLSNPPANMFTVETKQKQEGITKREVFLIAALIIAVVSAGVLLIMKITEEDGASQTRTKEENAFTRQTCLSSACIQLSSTLLQVKPFLGLTPADCSTFLSIVIIKHSQCAEYGHVGRSVHRLLHIRMWGLQEGARALRTGIQLWYDAYKGIHSLERLWLAKWGHLYSADARKKPCCFEIGSR